MALSDIVMTNVTYYNENTVKEASDPINSMNNKKVVIYELILAVCTLLIFYIGTKQIAVGMFIAAIVVGIAYVILRKYRVGKIAKQMMDQIRTSYQCEEFESHLVIDNKKIHTTTLGNEKDFYHSDLTKVFETKNLFVLFYKGNLYLFVEKDGFDDECEELYGDQCKTVFKKLIGR